MKIAMLTGFGMDVKCLTHFLLEKNYTVIVVTRRTTNFEPINDRNIFNKDLENNPESKLHFEYMDVSDQGSVESTIDKVIKEHGKIDEFYHLAASSHVGYSYDTAIMNIQTNGMSAFFILDHLRKKSPNTKYYFAATTELYSGNIKDDQYSEESPFHPKTPYACSKALGFYWTQYFREAYGTFACSGILGNHSSCERHNSFFIKKLTQTAAKIALGKEKELRIGHLNWARDEFWSDFGVEAMWKMLQLNEPQDFMIANGNCKWGQEYVDFVFNYFNLDKSKLIFDAQFLRRNEVTKLEVNPSKAVKMLGWKVNRMPFNDHLRLMCDWDFKVESGLIPTRPDVFKLYP